MSDSEPTVDAKAEEAAADAGPNNRKRRSYTAALKLEVVKIAKQSSLQAASKLFNIDRHMIRSWRADEEKLKLFNAPAFAGKKRMPGGGRPVKFKQLDDRIAAWVRERLDRQLPVSRRIIQMQAERMSCAEADGGDEKFFKASSGWLEKFLARHNFNLGNNSSSAVHSKSLDAVENMSADLSVSGQDNSELFEPVPMNSKANGQQFDNDSIADVFEHLQQHLDQPPNLSFFGTSTSTSNEDSCEATEQQQQVAGISLNSQLPALDHILVWALISPQRHQPPTSNNNNDSSNNDNDSSNNDNDSSNNSNGRRTYFMCNWQDLLDDGNAEEANNGTDTAEERKPSSSLAYVVHKKLSAIPDPSEEGCFSTSLPVNAVLNAFSTLGYRTIGMANKCTDEILWTLAKPLLKTNNIFTI